MEYVVAFITGLTTGGLSCLAVQGGLLTASLASQLESSYAAPSKSKHHPQLAQPILLFLGAKLIAYTLLGLLLGYLGSLFQLTTTMRAILLFAIAIFMLGNALRMLNVHPIFRYFSFEPPAFLRKYIRRKSKNGDKYFTPLFLGALTVLIPCGVTQSIMALAVASGSPIEGAILLFAFTLGTSPVFFAVTYFASRLGARLEGAFMRITAVVIIILALVSVESGLNLLGSPISVSRFVRSLNNRAQVSAPLPAAAPAVDPSAASGPFLPTPTLPAQEGVLYISVINSGYSPNVLQAPANQSLTLSLITDKTRSCSRAFVIPSLNIQELLPETGRVNISIPPQPAGSTLQFACSMGMYSGEIVFN